MEDTTPKNFTVDRLRKGKQVKPGDELAVSRYSRKSKAVNIDELSRFKVISTERRGGYDHDTKRWYFKGMFIDNVGGEEISASTVSIREVYGYWTEAATIRHAYERKRVADAKILNERQANEAKICIDELNAIGIECAKDWNNDVTVKKDSFILLRKLLPKVLVFAGQLKGI